MEALVQWEYKIDSSSFLKDSNREKWLNSLGEQGWELICPPGYMRNYYIFKRPIYKPQ